MGLVFFNLLTSKYAINKYFKIKLNSNLHAYVITNFHNKKKIFQNFAFHFPHETTKENYTVHDQINN